MIARAAFTMVTGEKYVLCVRRSGATVGSITAKLELAKIFAQFCNKLLEYELKVINKQY